MMAKVRKRDDSRLGQVDPVDRMDPFDQATAYVCTAWYGSELMTGRNASHRQHTLNGRQDEILVRPQSSSNLETPKKIVDEPEPKVVIVVKPVILLATEPQVQLGRNALGTLVAVFYLGDIVLQRVPESVAPLVTPPDELVCQLQGGMNVNRGIARGTRRTTGRTLTDPRSTTIIASKVGLITGLIVLLGIIIGSGNGMY